MLRVALSVKAGLIRPSAILRRLSTYSRKNSCTSPSANWAGSFGRLPAGLPVLTLELRRVIQAATNKSEPFNRYVQWLVFGESGLRARAAGRQRKLIKYNHLVANCLIFHNVQAQTRVLHQLAEEGHEFDEATLSRLSPYLTEHVNRFGKYTLNLDRDEPGPGLHAQPASQRMPQPVLATASL